ncbi:putative uncharacterized protein DDB_G0282133 [Spodoptera litura]|uniref:Uncharacterized protein n=1 Tax=Spodoptera litura TaxID=69820 RepID=A0A9J7DVR7_SPOLT|nr:putative uncharacterized protein DDB_G0282133 [Spodoptera litura]
MNIYYAHCSVLIKVAESKLKMSRSYCSYDEDWQRRKSILIRSLFHDLPTLSPVTEESDDSYPPVRSCEHLEVPQRLCSPLPPLIIERIPKINKHDEPEEHYKKLYIKIKRIYSRLFILNQNLSSDEEFFSDRSITDHDNDLHSPIAINNHDNDLNNPNTYTFNSPVNEDEDSNDLDDDHSDANDNTNSNEDNVRKSSDSNVSNGYHADSESIETVIVDVLNYTKSTNEEASKNTEEASKTSEKLEEESESINLKEEEESNPDKSNDDRSSDQEAGNDESSSTKEKDNGDESFVEEESSVSLTSNQQTNAMSTAVRTAQDIIDNTEKTNNQEMIEEESDDKSISYQDTQNKSNYSTEENNQELPNRENLVEIISQEEITDQEMLGEENNDKRNTNQSRKSSITSEESYQNISQKEITKNLRQDQRNRFEDLNKSRMNIADADEDEFDHSSTNDKEWNDIEESESLEEENSKELTDSGLEEIENAKELEEEEKEEKFADMPTDMMEEDETDVMSDIGSHFRQITTKALVHVDAFQDLPEIESQVYEGSPKSIILPVRRMKRTAAQAMLDKREELMAGGGNKESRLETSADSNHASFENIEEMRNRKRKLSQVTEPEINQESVSEESNEFNRSTHDLTDVTSSSQNGANFNISKRKTSDDLGEVLARILNDSENNVKNIRFYRERKNFEDVSVQTSENVSWDDIRKELFVGVPKIMRLCSCVDHVCQ